MRVILFAKAPIPGYAKTRLIPALGARGAARFHQQLVTHSLRTLCALKEVKVELHYSEPHPFFWRLAKRYHCQLVPQARGDLGRRMLESLRQGPESALIIGSDCPVITPQLVRRCIQALKGYELVLLPAEDGGYGLIGCQKPHHDTLSMLFENMPWGTAQVLEKTRAAAAKAQLRMQELETIWDIDTPDDLARWRGKRG